MKYVVKASNNFILLDNSKLVEYELSPNIDFQAIVDIAGNIDGDYICIRGGKIYEVDNRDDGVFVGIALDDSDSISAVYKDYLDRLMYKSDSIRIVDDLKVNETWYRRLR